MFSADACLESSFHKEEMIEGMNIARSISVIPPSIMYVVLLGISRPNMLKVSPCCVPDIVNVHSLVISSPLESLNDTDTLCKPSARGVSGIYINVYSESDILFIFSSSVLSISSILKTMLSSTIVLF